MMDDYTHLARFYGVPCYAKITDEDFVLVGQNRLYDWLLRATSWFHNAVIERAAQMMAAILDYPYEPGFPIQIKEVLPAPEEL